MACLFFLLFSLVQTICSLRPMLPSVALSKLCSTASNPLILEGMVDPNHHSQQEASSYTEATAINTGRSTTHSVVSNQDTQQLSQPSWHEHGSTHSKSSNARTFAVCLLLSSYQPGWWRLLRVLVRDTRVSGVMDLPVLLASWQLH